MKKALVAPLLLAALLMSGCAGNSQPTEGGTDTPTPRTVEATPSAAAKEAPTVEPKPVDSVVQVGIISIPAELGPYRLITDDEAIGIQDNGYPCHDLRPNTGAPQPQVIQSVMYSNNASGLSGVTTCVYPDKSLLSVIATEYGDANLASAAWGASMFATMPARANNMVCKVFANSICGALVGNRIWSVAKLTGQRGSEADLSEIAGYLGHLTK